MHFERRLSDLTVSALSMGRPSDDDLSRVPPHFKLSPRALHPPKITQPPSQIGLILRLRDLIQDFRGFSWLFWTCKSWTANALCEDAWHFVLNFIWLGLLIRLSHTGLQILHGANLKGDMK